MTSIIFNGKTLLFGGGRLSTPSTPVDDQMVEFFISDESSTLLDNVIININSQILYTNEDGYTNISLDNGTYSFSVFKENYIKSDGNVVVDDGNSTVKISILSDYELRDIGPGGGYIFYVNSNYESDGWKYLESAPPLSEEDPTTTWIQTALQETEIGEDAQGLDFGDGLSNTTAIIDGGAVSGAVFTTQEYEHSGYTDWFCASSSELNQIYTELHQNGLGAFTASSYWTSTENSSTEARRQSFGSGSQSIASKDARYRYRPVRSFLEVEYYEIIYNENGLTSGSLPSSNGQYYIKGSEVIVNSGTSMSKSGDDFVCWNTSPNGFGTDYYVDSKITITGNLEVYAKYQSNVIAFLPDTQNYTRYKPAIYEAQIDYLVDQKDDLNLAWVGHVGDIVQMWTIPEYSSEWTFVQEEMEKLTTADIGWGLSPGNHDYENGTRNSTVLNTHFPLSSFTGMTSFGGSYDTNSDNTYHTVTIQDEEWLIMVLEFGPRYVIIEWANDIIENNSSKQCIIMTHALLVGQDVPRLNEFLISSDNHAPSNGYGLGSVPTGCNNGIDLWNDLIYPNNNVRLAICGHDGDSSTGSALKKAYHADGSEVYNILTNYQYWANYPGYMLLFRIDSTSISFVTYSPNLDEFKTDDSSAGTFSF